MSVQNASSWSMAKVMNGFADLGNERFHTFAIKHNGVVVGQLKWKYRPKNAGGSAWQGVIFKSKRHYGMDVSYFGSSKADVLAWFKQNEDHLNTEVEHAG